jgi:hypothetical protein
LAPKTVPGRLQFKIQEVFYLNYASCAGNWTISVVDVGKPRRPNLAIFE